MQKRKSDEKGFTLIEVIVTLILVGITAALAGMWIVSVANGYIFARMNAGTVQKGQLAITRLTKEFSALQSVTATASAPTSITFNRADPGNPSGIPVTVSQSGNTLQLNVNNAGNSILMDNVAGFTLRYCSTPGSTTCPDQTWSSSSRIIEITLTVAGADNVPSTFTIRATPRNL